MPRLRPNNDYLVAGNIDGRNVAVRQGTTRLAGHQPGFRRSPPTRTASSSRASAQRAGRRLHRATRRWRRWSSSASPERCTISISTNWREPSPASSLGYDGVISGPVQADGNIKNPSAIVARANLGIAPGQPRSAGHRAPQRRLQRPRRHRNAGAFVSATAAYARRSFRLARPADPSECGFPRLRGFQAARRHSGQAE